MKTDKKYAIGFAILGLIIGAVFAYLTHRFRDIDYKPEYRPALLATYKRKFEANEDGFKTRWDHIKDSKDIQVEREKNPKAPAYELLLNLDLNTSNNNLQKKGDEFMPEFRMGLFAKFIIVSIAGWFLMLCAIGYLFVD